MTESIAIYNMQGVQVGDFSLDPTVFNGRVHKTAMTQSVLNYLANCRSGSSDTKTRDEVAGGGKKPWRQKGTGRARAGSIRSPLWRKGGIVFGPHPRDYSYTIPKKIKRLAFQSALNDKVCHEQVKILNEWALDEIKTKKMASLLRTLGVGQKALIALEDSAHLIKRAASNLDQVKVMRAQEVNTYDLVLADYLVLSKKALEELVERLS